jgi:hypothetical protein
MDEKRRLTRMRWTQDSGAEDVGASSQRPALWATPPTGSPFSQQSARFSEENGAGETEGAFVQGDSALEAGDASGEENAFPDDEAFDEYMEGEEISPEDAALLAQFNQLDEGHSLRNALLILIALYILCGLAPLFLGLFVSLRIFFWTEIGGGIVILVWLLIGVRPPFMVWLKERLRERQEQLKEQA